MRHLDRPAGRGQGWPAPPPPRPTSLPAACRGSLDWTTVQQWPEQQEPGKGQRQGHQRGGQGGPVPSAGQATLSYRSSVPRARSRRHRARAQQQERATTSGAGLDVHAAAARSGAWGQEQEELDWGVQRVHSWLADCAYSSRNSGSSSGSDAGAAQIPVAGVAVAAVAECVPSEGQQ